MSDLSCTNCPSYLKPDQTLMVFGKSTGSPMCKRFGHVLGKPGITANQAEKIAKSFAKDCPQHGVGAPSTPQAFRMQVMLPDPTLRVSLPDSDNLKKSCTTCASCTNFVREGAVAEELGWTTGLCAAKGKLILTTRQSKEAKDCEYRKWGTVRVSTDGLHLLPEYEAAFGIPADPTKAYFATKKAGGIIDPQLYDSDKPISAEDKESGIRAWRAVPDPDGGDMVAYLPIYDRDHFSADEQAKIPQIGDDEHPELYVDHFGGVYLAAVAWTELDETPAAWGEPGTGKTELYRHLAFLMNLPFERMSITASTELDDLAGKMIYTPEIGTYFQYGRFADAWQRPCVLCVDEPNTGPVDVWQFLRPTIDNSKQLILDTNKAERLTRHDDCYLGLAMNPAWDARNVGAQEIADADANRLFHMFVDLPPERLEREIIAARVQLDGWELSTDQMDFIMLIASELRELSKDGTLPVSWAIRPQIKVARALRWFAPITAYRRAVGDFLEREAQDVLLDVVKSHAGS